MRWLVTGAAGLLGTDVVETLTAAGADVRAAARGDLDVTDPESCSRAVAGQDVVVNCAAWTRVDDAEDDEAAAFAVNGCGAANIAGAAARAGARLVHLSTDYVFAGTASQPYPEDAPLAPASAYGRSKAAGEWAARAAGGDVLLVRTAWLYGAHGSCFPRTIARAAAEREHLDVVDDQRGQPTWTRDVADLVVRLVAAGVPGGVYHATSSGSASWFDLARAVVAAAGREPGIVRPVSSERFPRPAPRPAYSVLGHTRLLQAGVTPIGDWAARWRVAAPSVLG